MKKKYIILPVFAVILGIALFTLWQAFFVEGPTQENKLVLYGNVDIREVNLAFNVSERITKIAVEEGGRVHVDQVLARVRPDIYDADAAAAEARAKGQQAVLAKLESGTRQQEIRKAEAQLESARQTYNNARRTYQRLADLANDQLSSQQQTDDAKAAMEVAQAQFNAANETLKLLKAGPRKEDIAAARNKLEMFQAEMAVARRRLADTVLKAPSDGVIRDRLRQEGDMAFPSQPVLTLALMSPVWVRTYVPGPELGKIFPGMKAFIRTDSFPDKEYEGWVGYISPTAEFTPKTIQTTEIRTQLVYQVRVYACNPANELRLGMPVTIELPLDQSENAPSDPSVPPCEGPEEI